MATDVDRQAIDGQSDQNETSGNRTGRLLKVIRSMAVSLESLTVEINRDNAEKRILEAIHTLIRCWDEWEAQSQQDAQSSQHPDAALHFMEWQIGTVLQGMVFDDDPTDAK